MEEFKLVKVYVCHNNVESFGAFLSRGFLCDKLRDAFGKYYRGCQIDELLVETLPGELKGTENVDKVMPIYRRVADSEWDDPTVVTWMSEGVWRQRRYNEEYVNACEKVFRFMEQDIKLHTKTYPEPKFPFKVRFECDESDKLFTRFIQQPNVDGLQSKGKIFFPDRSWTNAFGGEARVTIKFSAKTYGVLLGEMIVPHSPDYQELLDYLWSKNVRGTVTLYEFEFPKWGKGKFYARDDYEDYSTLMVYTTTLKTKDNTYGITTMKVSLTRAEYRDATRQHSTINQRMLEDKFGNDFDLLALENEFSPCGFQFTLSSPPYVSNRYDLPQRKLVSRWVTCGDSVADDKVRRAVDSGIFTLRKLEGYSIYSVECNPEYYLNFCDYDIQDIKATFAAGAMFNRKAEEDIQARLRKGSLRFV